VENGDVLYNTWEEYQFPRKPDLDSINLMEVIEQSIYGVTVPVREKNKENQVGNSQTARLPEDNA
jgi:hypothetical protein